MLNRILGRTRGAEAPDEVSCPQCDRPMLRAWGRTCGLCRPAVAQPFAPDAIPRNAAAAGRTFAWLVVVDCPDPGRVASVAPLGGELTTLTREPGAGADQIAFRDDFMSSAHATVRRKRGLEGDSFQIADRVHPGPSANGTYVNARRLGAGEAIALCDGDVVRVGTTELVFRALLVPRGGAR